MCDSVNIITLSEHTGLGGSTKAPFAETLISIGWYEKQELYIAYY